uniref:Uncharacterized protein n=1 Tax=Anopheles dirus TaxID=7168 RepID=A0A182NW99_9DIPT
MLKSFLNPDTIVLFTTCWWNVVAMVVVACTVATSVGARSNPHVRTYLYTTRNTRKLTITSTHAVTTFANVFRPDSFGLSGRDELCSVEFRRLVARPRASAGKASDWVKVSLCSDSLREYGPTEPRAAARSSAYSRSRASNSDNRAVIVEARRWSSSGLSLSRSGRSQGSDELREDKLARLTWSGEAGARSANSRAWSGCSSEVDGRRVVRSTEGVGEPAVGDALGEIALDTTSGWHGMAIGEGDACTESIPESPACS